MNYQRFDEDLLIAGIVVRDFTPTTGARSKQLRLAGRHAIDSAQLAAVIERCAAGVEDLAIELRERKNLIVADYQSSESYKHDVVELIRPDLERTLAQAHDFKQFVQQIIQNLSVILERRYPELPIEQKLAQATHEEVAIYWAARLIDEKLDAALYFEYPERIHALHERGRFRFHGLVTKYRKIYERRIQARQLKTVQIGESRGMIEGNARAISIIPHALIDNAIKYAPAGTQIELHFEEVNGTLTFAVSSYGPPISEDEKPRVFEPFFRGSAAKHRDTEGTGFGLASAQNIALHSGSEILLSQEDAVGPEDTRRTTFSVSFQLVE